MGTGRIKLNGSSGSTTTTANNTSIIANSSHNTKINNWGKDMSKDFKDVLAFCCMLIRDKKFADIAISGATCLASIKSFNNVDEMMEYIETHNATELIIRKNGKLKFTDRMFIHNIVGFKLNEKSVTFLTNTMVGVGSRAGYRYNIRF